MKRTFINLLGLCLLLVVSIASNAQQSTNTVSYKITYDAASQVYTTWVVPNYNVPNSNNMGSTEKGATAQFTIIVPKDFVINAITDIRGTWDKAPLKMGPGQAGQNWTGTTLDANYNYYVIGKSASETDYGTFLNTQAVSLFTFKGNGCFGPVAVLPSISPFITEANTRFSLNVANSFYSRSGQPAGGNQDPLEQFTNVFGSSANCSATMLANPDSPSTPAGTSVTTSVLSNDTNNGNPATTTNSTVSISQNPLNGTVLVNADGTIKYTPNTGFSGTDCYVYQLCDKTVTTSCDTAKVCVNVTGATIIANPDSPSTPAGTPVTTNVLGNDTNNGTPATLTNSTMSISQNPSNGTVIINADGTIKYTPNPGYSGTDCYVYRLCDKVLTSACDTAKVCVNVTGAIIMANPDSPSTQIGTSITTNVLGNDTNNGNPATTTNSTVSISQNPSNGTVIVMADGTIKYNPNTGFSGTDCYVYKICDKTITTSCDTAKVCVNVVISQRIIYAFDDNNITKEATTVSGNVINNDVLSTGNAPLVVTTSPVLQPAHGTVTLNTSGTYTYTPVAGFTGTDIFKYQVCDSGTPAVCDVATVSINVKPSNITNNNAPVALSDNAVTKVNTAVSGNVVTNDKDPDKGQILTASMVTQPTHGTVILNANGTYTYTPTTGFVGSDSFTYKVCDNGTPSLCDDAVVNLTITGADVNNLPPVANDDIFFRDPAQGVSGNILTNDSDPNGGTLTVTATPVTNPSNGTVSINANGTFTYTPNAGYTGFDSFVYQVCNSQTPKTCSQATVYILTGNATGISDINITKTANKSTAALNDIITYTIVVKNNGSDVATNVVVKDSLSTGLVYQSASTTKGTFTNPNWAIPVLASGESATLTVTAKVTVEGVSMNYARIVSQDQTDPNTQNNTASACSSVPMNICRGDKIQLSVSSTYTDVKWYKDGIMVGSGNIYLASESGSYTTSATNNTCPASGCCPYVIVVTECCPANICIPVTVSKIIR